MTKDEINKTIDACAAYMLEQYGIGALYHPVDRERVLKILQSDSNVVAFEEAERLK